MKIFLWLTLLGLIITFITLFMGLITMSRGKDFNQRHGNKIMRLRVVTQLFTVTMFVCFLLT